MSLYSSPTSRSSSRTITCVSTRSVANRYSLVPTGTSKLLSVEHPSGEFSVVLAAARRETKEAKTRERLPAGELGLDVYGMREELAKAGLKYFADEAALERESRR